MTGEWLTLDAAVYTEGEARGLWQQINALAEGIAVDAEAGTLWLAAERQARGLIKLQRQGDEWKCPLAGCVLLAERRLPANRALWSRYFESRSDAGGFF